MCETKKCFSCQEFKPVTKEHFYISRTGAPYGYCKPCALKQRREWSRQNKEKNTHHVRMYRAKHPEATLSRYREAAQKRRINPLNDVKDRIRKLIAKALKKVGGRKSSKTLEIVGCTKEELTTHIERQFQAGMSWDNRQLWHIDHIIPLATATTEEEVIKLNHFTNLRPLWAHENLSKGSKLAHLI